MTPNSGEYGKDEFLQKITAAGQQVLAAATVALHAMESDFFGR
jgi:hypothetical protein